MKKLAVVVLCFVLMSLCTYAASTRVLYDDKHGQTAGNADWIASGAYSDMIDMLKANGFKVENLGDVSDHGIITPALLEKYAGLILAEPNNPYSDSEQEAIVEFVRNGGGAFLIGDHGRADRDNDGWDAVLALNSFCPNFGFKFKGDFLYEAPLSGKTNKSHPTMYGVRGVGVWAGSTFDIIKADDAKAVGIIDSRQKKAPYVVASEFGKGRVLAIGDSSPFDDGTGSGGHNKLHDSYDSFMYSHPQLAYNAMTWVTGNDPKIRIPSKKVEFFNEALARDKDKNILIDAAHGNAASDKMETFEKHMKKLGFKVYYTLNLLRPKMLENFAILIVPDPSLRFIGAEIKTISDWFRKGGKLVMAGSWDSSRLRGTSTLNKILNDIGSVMILNDDQVWDETNKTNKPWGVLAHVLKKGHPVTEGVKTVITWGTCSLLNRNRMPLTEEAGVDILLTGDDDTFNKDGKPKIPAVIYPKNHPIPIMAIEKIVNGTLVLIGCCNFTDFQYPDSDINMAQPGPSPFKHETPTIYDNLMKFLANN